jgi:phosphonoacetaldehyde hydrolase
VRRIEAVIFDWAGTTVDHGSLAPVAAITELFEGRGIRLSPAAARRDMGLFKKDHIRRILALPEIDNAWRNRYGEQPDEAAVESLFQEFLPLQMAVLEKYSDVICGVQGVASQLRAREIKVGGTTGYTRPMLNVLLLQAAKQGYCPDLSLCPDDTGRGRPYPLMCLRIALEFQLSATSAAVKVGDTPSDIEEGVNAGMWTVGVAATGNEIGLGAEDLAALPEAERAGRITRARNTLEVAGAHYVVDSVASLEPALEAINERLGRGERP